jgi:ABC-type antimicrobial peptide transport system permease subunit
MDDQEGSERGVVVNEALTRFWGEGPHIGRRIRAQGSPDAWIPVLGVVADSKVRSLSEPPTPMVYFVMDRTGYQAPYVIARTSGDPSLLLSSMRTQLQGVNPRVSIAGLSTLEGHLGETLAGTKVSTGVLGLFSLLALLLASVGIYTIVSFSVAGQLPEIGIRMALGAGGSRVVLGVMGGTAFTVGIGLLAGGAVVLLLSARVQGLLFGVDVISARTLLPAVMVMVGAVTLASYLPARRASRVDPMEALRAQ